MNKRNEKLYRSCEIGSLKSVKKYLKKPLFGICADINYRKHSDFNDTPLHVAVKKGYKEIVELLINNGAIINIINDQGYTPLFSSFKYVEIVELLLKNGAEINIRAYENQTPLFYACGHGSKEIVKLLIDNGADVSIKDDQGKTPLFSCISNENSVEIVKLLIEEGVDINAIERYLKQSALFNVCFFGNGGVAEILINKGAKVDLIDDDGCTPLYYTVYNKEFGYEIADLLIKNGIDVNNVNKNGDTALDWAINNDNDEIKKLLIIAGATQNKNIDKQIKSEPSVVLICSFCGAILSGFSPSEVLTLPNNKLHEFEIDLGKQLSHPPGLKDNNGHNRYIVCNLCMKQALSNRHYK